MTRPLRRMTLHLSQIFFTLGFTFTIPSPSCSFDLSIQELLVSISDTTSCEVIWTQFYDHTILRKDADVVLSHLPGDVCQHNMPIGQLHAEHRVRERFCHNAFDFDGAVFFGQALPTQSLLSLWGLWRELSGFCRPGSGQRVSLGEGVSKRKSGSRTGSQVVKARWAG